MMKIHIKRDGWTRYLKGREYRVPTSVGRVLCRQGYADEVKGEENKSGAPAKADPDPDPPRKKKRGG